MRCDVHKDRGGILFVDLPSIGIRRWGCFECRASFDKSMLNSPRSVARKGMMPWEIELRTGNPGETLGMEGREATHAAMTKIAKERPNDR